MKYTTEGSSVVLYSYDLPSVKGEGWATVVLTSQGAFLAISDYGTYGYDWGLGLTRYGHDLRSFLADAEQRRGYLIEKLSEGRYEYDGESVVKEVRSDILELRRRRSWNKDRAREEWYLVEEDDLQSDMTLWSSHTTFDLPHEYYLERPRHAVVAFVDRVLIARLAPLLAADPEVRRANKETGAPVEST